MSQVLIELDNRLKKPEIQMPLVESSKQEAGDNYPKNQSGNQQTSTYGIQTPLIQINNIIIDFANIISFDLSSTGILPEISMEVIDKYGLIEALDTPGNDNELVVQILPPFDEAYKKINLVFYISQISIEEDVLILNGIYKLPKLTDTQFKAFGKINTYKLFKTIAEETELGFATNVKENDQDSRYVYCSDTSYKDILNDEVGKGGTQTEIYDWWIDYWDNINLVDIYERYNAKDKDEDMMLWVSGQTKEIDEGTDIEPHQVVAAINNHPHFQTTELFVRSFEINNDAGLQVKKGTDRVYSIYKDSDGEYEDFLIQDGDSKKDIFKKISYMGELYGDYNYIFQSQCRKAYLQKINTETIDVHLNAPLLGLMRGQKVNFIWYKVDSELESKMAVMEENNGIDSHAKVPINIEDNDTEGKGEGSFKIDKSITGQYLIKGVNISYNNNSSWDYTLTLCRPSTEKPKLMKTE